MIFRRGSTIFRCGNVFSAWSYNIFCKY
jgi:hypothetical protein